jgi:hypothetical protein
MFRKIIFFALTAFFVLSFSAAGPYLSAAPAVPLTQAEKDEVEAVRDLISKITTFKEEEYKNAFSLVTPEKPLKVKIGSFTPTAADDVARIVAGGNVDFTFDPADFLSRSGVEGAGGGAVKDVQFHSMNHIVTFWDNSRAGIVNPVTGAGKHNIKFDFVTDPICLKVITIAFFTFKFSRDAYNTDFDTKWCYALEANRLQTYDETPPDAVFYSNRVLFTTTGGKITEFNKRAGDYGFKHPNGSLGMEVKNPEKISVLVKDNNVFSSFDKASLDQHDPRPHRFGVTTPTLAFYVETYRAFYKELDNAAGGTKAERMLGETIATEALGTNPATPEGRFGWIGPIWLDDLDGWTVSVYPMEVEGDDKSEKIIKPVIVDGIAVNKNKLCSVYNFNGPLKSLETAVEKLTGDPEAMRYSLHFASLANMLIPVSAGNNVRFLEHQFNDETLGFKEEKMMRICTAVLDSSGNLRMPWLSRTIDEKKVLADFQAKFGAAKLSKAGLCDEMIVVVPYDDRLPGAVLSLTNTETNVTTSFTIPNYDCLETENASAGAKVYFPFAEQAEVWHFKYDGDTDAMKWLKQKDPKRYDEYIKALTINEDVRLIFDMVGYDNINKYLETIDSDKTKIGQYGISTEMAGAEKGVENLYYRSWRIDDPTGTESLLYENKAEELFVYPDYMFRNPEQGKTYKVSFFVEDFSPFFNSKGSAVVPQPPKRSGNIRQIILEFDVKGRAVQSHSMGGSTTTTNTVLETKNEGK